MFEILGREKPSVAGLIQTTFQFNITSRVKCGGCDYNNPTTGMQQVLSLGIVGSQNITLDDCLRAYHSEESLEDSRCEECGHCNQKKKALRF